MRILGIIMTTFLVAGCEVAPLGANCGRVGTSCEDGARCVDGTCTPCGAQGEVCCTEAGGSTTICDGNVACANATYDYGVCDGNCGEVGLPCCENTCPTSGTCYLGACVDDGAGDGCHDPYGQPHKVYTIDGFCVETLHDFATKTPEKAEECRQGVIDNYAMNNVNVEACPLDGAPEYQDACGVSQDPALLPNSVHFAYCSDAWLDQCKKMSCANCEWTETTGSCPSGD